MKKVIVRLHWKIGEIQDIETTDTGNRYETIANAMLFALDSWEIVKDEEGEDETKS